jgi:mono/diheme cytochrome c family protein
MTTASPVELSPQGKIPGSANRRSPHIGNPQKPLKEHAMKNRFRSLWVLAVFAVIICATCFAQSPGEAVYKQKCVACHGPDGVANSGVGKIMRVKPVSDPEVRKLTEAEMIELTRNGVGKMQPYKGELTDAQIKASVDYFRRFIK